MSAYLTGLADFAQTSAGNAARAGLIERASKLSRRLHLYADSEIAKLQAQAEAVACRPGCCQCCRGIVPVALPELLDLVATLADQDRQALLTRCSVYEEASRAHWQGETPVVQADCPLLVDGRCSVYENRPLHCRANNSYDPSLCARILAGERIPAQVLPGQGEIAGALMAGMVAGLAEGGQPSGHYELGTALRFLLSNPEPDSRDLERYRVNDHRERDAIPLNQHGEPLLHPPLNDLVRPGMSKMETYQAAVRLAPVTDVARLFHLVLPETYSSDDELESWWDRYQTHLNQLCDVRLDPKLAFEALGFLDLFHLAYNGKDVKPVVAQFMGHAFGSYAQPAHPQLTAPFEHPRKPGKFRVGYASSRLTHYNGSRWALGWLAHHGPDMETYAFNLSAKEDAVSARWRHLADHYYHLPMGGSEAGKVIRPLDLDALILTDIGEDGITLQLALLRLARRQYTAWGHVVTSGSPVIDGYLSSADMEPEDGDAHYTETLIRLPGSGQTLPVRQLPTSESSRSDLGLPAEGYYLLAQNPGKLLPARDAVWRRLTETTRKPILISSSVKEAAIGQEVLRRMQRAGVRAQLLPYMALPDFAQVMRLADCVLDSFDFSGGITTVDTLTLRKPLVSCPGRFMRGRMSLPFLKQAGMAGLIAPDEDAYVELAANPDRLAAAITDADPEPIFNDLRPVNALNALLLEGAG